MYICVIVSTISVIIMYVSHMVIIMCICVIVSTVSVIIMYMCDNYMSCVITPAVSVIIVYMSCVIITAISVIIIYMCDYLGYVRIMSCVIHCYLCDNYVYV